MLLAIDAGNTNIKLGLFQKQEPLANWRLITDRARTPASYGGEVQGLFSVADLDIKDVAAVIIASVVPQLNDTLKTMCEHYLKRTPVFVDHTMKTGLKIRYKEPAELGADRIVDAVAAVKKYGPPCIVVDFGTATTFNAINSKRQYLGGIIAPGIMTAANALFSLAAQLPPVRIERPKNVIGKSTVEAMQSGIYYGYANLVNGLIEDMFHAMQETPKVIVTGGVAALIKDQLHDTFEFDENLTLDGLRIVYEMNKS
ncbi:MAG TPA: type III pantothenate kinase [Pyrinomonadaceae bacterium]|nr:type III pantothenate kinase [Pyrinomonadaceae bacterium]